MNEENKQENNSDIIDRREELAQRFKEKVEPVLQDKTTDKDGNVHFHPVDPTNKFNPWWTVTLVVLIVLALIVMVFLVLKGGMDKSVIDKQEKLVLYNQTKAKFDQSLIDATNKLIETQNSFNEGKYAKANDYSKQAVDIWSNADDNLSDVEAIEMGADFMFLDDYNRNLQEAVNIGKKMSNSIAYASRSADRAQETDAKKSLDEYKTFAGDFTLLTKKINDLKKQHEDFFGAIK